MKSRTVWSTSIEIFLKIFFKFIPQISLNPNLGVLYRDPFWGEGGGETKITPYILCQKLVRIMLETSGTIGKYTRTYFRKFTFWYQVFLNFEDVSFFCKKAALLCNNSTSIALAMIVPKQHCGSFVIDFLALPSVFIK